MLRALLGLAALWSFPSGVLSQGRPASLALTVVDDAGAPISRASVTIGARWALTNSAGRLRWDSLPPGTIRVRVRVLGYEARDTVLSLRAGSRTTWKAVLSEPRWEIEARERHARSVAAGGIDSVAAGLVTPDTSGSFDFARFGIAVLRSEVNRLRGESSLVLSPVSAGQALGIVLLAARDSTAAALQRALRLGPLDGKELAQRAGRFNRLLKNRGDVTLLAANALWVDSSTALADDFAQATEAHYNALAKAIPLHGPEAPSIINHWVDSNTRGRIRELIGSPFKESIRVVVTNATYFHGTWLGPFDKQATQDRPFTPAVGPPLQTPTMDKTASWAYRRGEGFQALRVPYRAGLTALYVVLPDSGIAAETLLTSFERVGWPVPQPASETRLVHLRLPRLHLERGLDLRPPLTGLGAGIAFDSSYADFSGLVRRRPTDPPWCPPLSSGLRIDVCMRYRIDEAKQRVYFDLDEQGTEAAAVTLVTMEEVITSSPERPQPIEFLVERPFMFALRDERTGSLLFIGYIATPKP